MSMLSVGRISEGFVLDHIQAGKSMEIYKYLNLDKLDCTVAIIKNARSGKMGKKDLMKIECPIDYIDMDVLGFIDHNITVNIVKDEKVTGEEDPDASQGDSQYRKVQESPLHHFH